MGTGGDYLITSRERRTRGSHDFKFIVPKGHKNILRFSKDIKIYQDFLIQDNN